MVAEVAPAGTLNEVEETVKSVPAVPPLMVTGTVSALWGAGETFSWMSTEPESSRL